MWILILLYGVRDNPIISNTAPCIDKSLYIKKVSRDFFMGTDIGTRVHKDKKKYSRKIKHKKNVDYND